MSFEVVYATKTGHSRKLANAIAKELGIEPIDMKSGKVPHGAELMFLVGGIYGGESLPETEKYIEALRPENVKRAVLVTSCATGTTQQNKLRGILFKNGIEVLPNEFICKGGFFIFRFTRPNNKDIEQAVEFAKKTVATIHPEHTKEKQYA